MQDNRYWCVHHLDMYINDAISQIMALPMAKSLKTPQDIARHLQRYFQLVHTGHHVLHRNYNFVASTFYNRGAFCAALYNASKPVCVETELLKIAEYHQIASLFCADIPIVLFQNLVKHLALKDELHSKLSLGDFIYAFQALFCFGKLLDGLFRIFGKKSDQQTSTASSNNVVVQLPTANDAESGEEADANTGRAKSQGSQDRVLIGHIEELFAAERKFVASCFVKCDSVGNRDTDMMLVGSTGSRYSDVSTNLQCAYLLKIVVELAKYASFRFEKFFELFAYDARVNRIVGWLPTREVLLNDMKAAAELKATLPFTNLAEILRSDILPDSKSSEAAQQTPSRAKALPLSMLRNRALLGKVVSAAISTTSGRSSINDGAPAETQPKKSGGKSTEQSISPSSATLAAANTSSEISAAGKSGASRSDVKSRGGKGSALSNASDKGNRNRIASSSDSDSTASSDSDGDVDI